MSLAPVRSRPTGGFGLTALWALYALTFRQHLHGRRWIVMAAVFLLPAALAVLVRATAPQVPLRGVEFMMAFMFIPQALLPLIALVYASGIIQDEQEDQTLTYLLIRPTPKWAIYLVKLAATLTTTVLLTTLFTILVYAAIYLGGGESIQVVAQRCLLAVGIHSLAVVAYCCVFGLISLLTRWALVAGIIYAALIEGILANMPFSLRMAAIIYHTRLIAYRNIDFVISGEYGRQENIASAAWQLPKLTDLKEMAEHLTTPTNLLVLVGASVVCALIGAVICARREFYVKTPGGN